MFNENIVMFMKFFFFFEIENRELRLSPYSFECWFVCFRFVSGLGCTLWKPVNSARPKSLWLRRPRFPTRTVIGPAGWRRVSWFRSRWWIGSSSTGLCFSSFFQFFILWHIFGIVCNFQFFGKFILFFNEYTVYKTVKWFLVGNLRK